MPGTSVKRSQMAHFINTASIATPTWELIGDGITDAEIGYNPQTSEEVYIHQNSGAVEVESYKPTLPLEGTLKTGDPASDYIETLRITRAILGAAQSEVVNVWLWKTPTAGKYPAERQVVNVQFDKIGGPGGESNKIGYTLNFVGDPTVGFFDPATKTWSLS